MAEKLNIISWNVNGIRASIKKGFYEKIKEMDPDIFCIQETKAQDDILAEIAVKLPEYKWFVNSALKKGYSGTAIFTRQEPLNHSYDMGIPGHDEEGRLITLEYDQFFLVNAYVPNSGQGLKRLEYRKTWDQALVEFLKKLDEKKPVIFTGDMNVAHESIDLARPKENYNKTAGYTQTEIDGFNNLLSENFIDTFRHFHKDKVQYTFWNQRFKARERNVGWRIDYFLVSNRFIRKVNDSVILDQMMGSDHCPIRLDIQL
jgi:exodeoxyribonuclease III